MLNFPIDTEVSWGINGKSFAAVSITADSGDMVKQDMSIEDGINGKIVFQGPSQTFRNITLRCLGSQGIAELRAALAAQADGTLTTVSVVLNNSIGTYYYYELSESGNQNALDKNNVQIYEFTLTLIGPAETGIMYIVP
jgi:hypothetical protein